MLLFALLALGANPSQVQDKSAAMAEAQCIQNEAIAFGEAGDKGDYITKARDICVKRYGWDEEETKAATTLMVISAMHSKAWMEASRAGVDMPIIDEVWGLLESDDRRQFGLPGIEERGNPDPIIKKIVQMLGRRISDKEQIKKAASVLFARSIMWNAGLHFAKVRWDTPAP